jgi:hypothetical protein
MQEYQYKNSTIRLFNDPEHSIGSSDNKNTYLHYHFTNNSSDDNLSSKHGIKIFENETEIGSCLVNGFEGATGIYENSFIIEDDVIILCCSDSVCCLNIPQLNMLWCTKVDLITCFQIFKLDDDYIIHGETEISRIDKNGKIKWQFSGVDIFVTMDSKDEFIMFPDHIQLIDFGYKVYKIDYEGKSID